jgi:hypothetical protein
MDMSIALTFTDKHKYQLEFCPPDFWKRFAEGYDALPWAEISDGRVAVIAESYSYLLDMLVQARLYYLSTMAADERFK